MVRVSTLVIVATGVWLAHYFAADAEGISAFVSALKFAGRSVVFSLIIWLLTAGFPRTPHARTADDTKKDPTDSEKEKNATPSGYADYSREFCEANATMGKVRVP